MGNSASNNFGSRTTTEEACMNVDLSGQLAIVTGCSAGIGIQTVKQLVAQGCTVVMANRNEEKAKKAKETIITSLLPKSESKDNAPATDPNSGSNDPATTDAAAKDTPAADTTDAAKDETNDTNDNANVDANAVTDAATEKKESTTEEKTDTAANDQPAASSDSNSEARTDLESRLILLKLDLSSLESVNNFITAYKALGIITENKLPLRFLINNAGIMALNEFNLSKDEYELQFATNVLGHYYLTNLVLDYYISEVDAKYFTKTENSYIRVVNVSSSAHNMAPSDMKRIMKEGLESKAGPKKEDYSAWGNYGLSKAGNVLFSRELVDRYGDQGVYSFSLHPGFIMSELQRNLQGATASIISFIGNTFGKTINQGASTTIYVCCEDIAKLTNGEYYNDCNAAFENKLAKRFRKGNGDVKELQTLLWDWCKVLIRNKGFKLGLNDNNDDVGSGKDSGKNENDETEKTDEKKDDGNENGNDNEDGGDKNEENVKTETETGTETNQDNDNADSNDKDTDKPTENNE